MTNTVRPRFQIPGRRSATYAEGLPGGLLTACHGTALWQAVETEFGSACVPKAIRSSRATSALIGMKESIVRPAGHPKGEGL